MKLFNLLLFTCLSFFTFSQDDNEEETKTTTVKTTFTTKKGEKIEVKEGDQLRIDSCREYTVLYYTPKGKKNATTYNAGELKEFVMNVDGIDYVYTPHKGQGSLSKVLLRTIFVTESVGAYTSLSTLSYGNINTFGFILIAKGNSTPKSFTPDLKHLLRLLACNKVNVKYKNNTTPLGNDLLIEILTYYDQTCGAK